MKILMLPALLLLPVTLLSTALPPAETEPVYSREFLLGKFNPAKHPDFRLIAEQYAGRSGMYLHKAAYDAFVRMAKAASQDGIRLVIVSATRNFYAQKTIWEAKWTGERLVEGKDLSRTQPDPVQRALTILRYSSMPGTSRHHWGTDIDLNDLNNQYFTHGKGLKIYQWLQTHGAEYGYYQVYTPKPPRPAGYEEEKWHWTYLPVSLEIIRQYQQKIRAQDINGFLGDKAAASLPVIRDYVLGVNPEILP